MEHGFGRLLGGVALTGCNRPGAAPSLPPPEGGDGAGRPQRVVLTTDAGPHLAVPYAEIGAS